MAGDKKKSAKASLFVRATHVFEGLLLIVVAFGWWWAIQMGQADKVEQAFWTKTSCRITQSSWQAVSKGYKFLVLYEYDVNGEVFTSNRHRLNPVVFYSVQEAIELSQKYPPGANSFCYVNPKNPTNAVLETDKRSLWFLYPVYLAFLFGAGSGFRKAWLALPFKYVIGDYALLERLAIACLMASILACGLAYGRIPALWSAYANAPSDNWEKTECTVTLSRVLTHQAGPHDLYKADVLYYYFFKGKQYWTDAYKFGEGFSKEYDSQAAIIANYPIGDGNTCFVNPQKPSRAVLKMGYSPDLTKALYSLLIIIPGLFGIILAFWPGAGISDWVVSLPESGKKKTRGSKSKSMLIMPVFPRKQEPGLQTRRSRNERKPNRRVAGFSMPQNQTGEDYVVLRTGFGAIGPALGVLLLNLVLTAAAFFMIADSTMAEAVIETLIYAPVGVSVFSKSGPYLLAAFNPRVTVTIHASSLCLGDRAKLTWETTGSLGKARRLVFILTGEEKVIFKRGKRKLSRSHQFYREEQFRTSAPSLMQRGETELCIPLETMHSLETKKSSPGEAKHYFVNWKLQVYLVMDGRKDTRNEYPLHILPLDVSKVRERSDRILEGQIQFALQ